MSTASGLPVSRRHVIAHLVLGIVVVAGMAWGINVLGQRLIDVARLRAWVVGFGNAAPLAFILVAAIAHLFFLPVAPFTVAAVALFHWPVAVVVILVSHNLAANLGYLVPFIAGRERMRRLWHQNPRLERFDEALCKRGFMTVLLLRIVPGLPFSLVSYLSSIAGIRWGEYALASFLGMLPGPITLAVVLAHGGNV